MNRIVKISDSIRMVRYGLRTRATLAALIMTMVSPAIAVSQATTVSADPMTTVEQFKKSLDADDVESMCELMAESDGSGPLKRLHFEKMQSSMSELIKLWQYTPFSYGASEINDGKTPYRATVQVIARQMKQEVRFTLLKFGARWYISDIEIFFK